MLTAPRPRLFIGDVHACAAELETLLDHAGFDPSRHRGILIGDLYTRGPDPLGVWRLTRDLGLDAVRGNHEDYLLDQLGTGGATPTATAGPAPAPAPASAPAPTPAPDASAIAQALGPALGDALQAMEATPRWIRSDPDDPHGPWVAVHGGVDPYRGFEAVPSPHHTRLRFWPPEARSGTRWHELYGGDDLVVFGHDARGGLVEHRSPDGRPRAIGLDTGCVYGGRLTGWWLERDTFVSVPALRVYSDPRRGS